MRHLGASAGREAGSRLRVGEPLTVHGPAQELLHTPRHVHRVLQVEVPVGVQDGVGAWERRREPGLAQW